MQRMMMVLAVLVFMVQTASGQLMLLEPPRCPVMQDEYADQTIFTEHEGRKVFLCCERCRINFSKQPEKYVMHLASVGQAQEFDWSVLEPEEEEVLEEANDAPGMSAPPEDQGASAGGSGGNQGGVMGIFGRSHVVWVHFPIACLVIAGVIRLGALIGFEGTKGKMGASGMLLMIGALGAVVSAGSGLVNPQGAAFEGMQGLLHETFDKHKLLGLVLAGLSVAAVMAEVWSVRKPGGNRNAAHGAVVVCGALAVVVAHLGGTLTHGPGFLLP